MESMVNYEEFHKGIGWDYILAIYYTYDPWLWEPYNLEDKYVVVNTVLFGNPQGTYVHFITGTSYLNSGYVYSRRKL